jgi:hypothetical protein
VNLAGDNRGMNEPVIPGWFLESVVFALVLQTILLFCACFLIRDWSSKLNRKLHRIESNTRHAAKALGHKEEEDLDKVTQLD